MDPIKAIDGRFITALAAKDIPTIRVTGYVGESFTGAELSAVAEYLCEEAGECRIMLDTVGGYVYDAWHFYDYVRHKGLKVYVEGFGRVMSAGTVIMAAAGRKRSRLSPNAAYLIHNVSGSDDEAAMEVENEKLRSMYVELTGMSRKRIKDMMDKDTPITAQEAFEMGFVGGVLELQKLAASSGLNIQDMTENVDVKTAVVEDHTELDESGNPTIIEPTADVDDTAPEVVQVEQEVEITVADYLNSLRGKKKKVMLNVSAYYGEAVEALAEELKSLKNEKDEAVAEAERLSEGMTNVASELENALKAQGEAEATIEKLNARIAELENRPAAPKVTASAAPDVQEPGEIPASKPERKPTKVEQRIQRTIEAQKARMSKTNKA